ncbi:MAG: diaminopimelate epimerase, partial [Oscillospiraceae bacterium]|nr:diaminopimelate epimerase [Oscillospiraceae bacterium]
KAELNPEKIPVKIKNNLDKLISYPTKIDGKDYNITCVCIGNPHCVVFCNDVDSLDLAKLGPKFENDDMFPDKVNTEFVKVIDQNTLQMRVWERGSGETMACGTGACAAVVAAVENGFCKKEQDVSVKLLGGILTISYNDEAVFMTGDAVVAFEGKVNI